MSQSQAYRPLRIFDKILHGGLGQGNLGVLVSRHGTGKVAVMTSIAIDHALNGVNTLHAVYGKSVESVRAYDDEVLEEILSAFDIQDRAEVLTRVERSKQIYTYRSGTLNAKRLRGTMEFLTEHAQFRPRLVEIQGWPDFETITADEVRALKGLAVEFECEMWLSAHTHGVDATTGSIPDYVNRFEPWLSVILSLQPEADRVNLRFVKTHDFTPADGVQLQFDPKTMLVRWR